MLFVELHAVLDARDWRAQTDERLSRLQLTEPMGEVGLDNIEIT